MQWTPVADLGHAAGFDFDLGRCANCSRWVMAVFYTQTTYDCLTDEFANECLRLREKPQELKSLLRRCYD
ncbi:MAG: hypothetical protein KIT83_22110 [Bryobacterales bacterium]|nr:hypothetical protein [Bryobacterales bacterium]